MDLKEYLVNGNFSRDELIEIFNDTIEQSKTKYLEETKELLRNTRLYDNLDKKHKENLVLGTYNIKFETNDTVTAIIEHKKKDATKKVCALNFADSTTPGGLVLYGEKTQEECLCRSSNLYCSLLLELNKENYYKYNEQFNDKGSNRIIYSPDTLFFKNVSLEEIEPVKCDIITSPAPIKGTATEDEIISRMICILLSAKENQVDTLIIGNWGCGVFGNDKIQFAGYWKKALSIVDIKEVIYAAPSGYEDIKNVFG